MRIAARVFANQTDHFQHLVDLFVHNRLVRFAADGQTFRNDFVDRHSGVERSNRVLENHLNLRREALALGDVLLVGVFALHFVELVRGCGFEDFSVLCVHLVCHRVGVDFVALFVVESRLADFLAVLGDDALQFFLARRVGLLHFRLRRGNRVLVALHARGDALALEVDVAGRNVIELDDGAAGRGLAAAGFADQPEDLALLDVEGNVIDRLVRSEILTKMLYLQQYFLLSHWTSPPLSASFSQCG